MALKIYNTLTKKIEEFKPIEGRDFVGIYNCGPTLHNFYPKLVNLRSYLFADFIKRYLIYKGYKVKHVIKVTDVDDHALKECLEEGITLKEHTKKHLGNFISQMDKLNILQPILLPQVTDNISEILSAIKLLSEKNLTYKSNGSVYFKVSELKSYGELVNLEKQASLRRNAQKRLKDFVSEDKENINDFCMWKAYRPELDGDVFWESEFGKGRPGWHIGCSVISRKYLGENFDIHIGSAYHVFPHHTNELALAEAISNGKFVNYWVHNDSLVVDDERVSKENILLLRDIVEKGYPPLVLRYLLLRTHYRQKLNFTWRAMDEAETVMLKIITFLNSLDFVENELSNEIDFDKVMNETEKEFTDSMDKDLNVSDALKSIFSLIKSVNKNFDKLNRSQAEKIKEFVLKLDFVFGCFKPLYDSYKEEMKKQGADGLFKERILARKNKDYSLSDSLKKQICDKGFIAKDCSSCSIYELKNFMQK